MLKSPYQRCFLHLIRQVTLNSSSENNSDLHKIFLLRTTKKNEEKSESSILAIENCWISREWRRQSKIGKLHRDPLEKVTLKV